MGPARHSIKRSSVEASEHGVTNGVTSENHAALETVKIHSNIGRELPPHHHCDKDVKETDTASE